jgi:hypothetical protein
MGGEEFVGQVEGTNINKYKEYDDIDRCGMQGKGIDAMSAAR